MNEILAQQQEIIDIFTGFRQELMQAYGNIAHDSKQDESPVTELDIKVEKAVKERLLAKFPDVGIRGEETAAVESTNGITWYLDPIDSTLSFIHGLPYCANMAACVVNDEIVASVVYHFAADEMFTAVKGRGAYKNDIKLSVHNIALKDSCVFADAFAYKNIYTFYKEVGVRFYAPVGATGYFMTRLAQGSIQGICYAAANLKPHDVAPGALLVQEAGGQFVTFNDQAFSHESRQFFAGTPALCQMTIHSLQEIKTIARYKESVK